MITAVALVDAAGKRVHFDPQPDITALEVARCLELFTKMMLNMEPSPLAWEGYIVEHGIQRHFREDIDVGAQQAS